MQLQCIVGLFLLTDEAQGLRDPRQQVVPQRVVYGDAQVLRLGKE